MLYDLASEVDRKKLDTRLKRLQDKADKLPRGGSLWVDVTAKERQTTNQNNYLHLCCEFLGYHVGLSKECVKDEIFKRAANPDLFIISESDREGRMYKRLRHSCDLTKEELSQAIENFRLFCLDYFDFELPDSEDYNDCMRLQQFCERLRTQQK